ncbi:MAG: hypothetical protein ACJA0V_000876, partial [Planctomycetota bacterium]
WAFFPPYIARIKGVGWKGFQEAAEAVWRGIHSESSEWLAGVAAACQHRRLRGLRQGVCETRVRTEVEVGQSQPRQKTTDGAWSTARNSFRPSDPAQARDVLVSSLTGQQHQELSLWNRPL